MEKDRILKNFRTHFNEASIPNWTSLVSQNKELQAALGLISEIERLGGECIIVGGAVRDLLLGQQPKDIDLATNVDLNKIQEHFKSYDIGQSKDFGIIAVPYNGFQFEVAHYRKDVY